jgi:hypothetical protein
MTGGARGGWANACNATNRQQKPQPKILVKEMGAPLPLQTSMFEAPIRDDKDIGRDTAWFVVKGVVDI